MAALGEGYDFGEYLLFGVADALRVTNDDAVEAVFVGTPYERLRFGSYVIAYQGRTFAAGEKLQFVESSRDVLAFVVFAHSHGETDREFMRLFGPGSLARGAASYSAEPIATSDPVLDSYYRPNGTFLERWLGQVTYRFDLRNDAMFVKGAAPAIFSFVDDRGVVRRYTVVLQQYR